MPFPLTADWFVEAEGVVAATAPVALWVQGGPGGSSMTGMWTENMGPFALDLDALDTDPPTLRRSQSPWTAAAHMLFWEAPAGVGFSYCDGGGKCPHYNDTTAAEDNAATICAWLELFPEFKGHPFYMIGESYAGVYIPTAALTLIDSGLCGGQLNLSGLMIGNGCTGTDAGTCSPGRHTFTIEHLYQQAMISQPTKASIDTLCADSMGLTMPSALCARALTRASDEAGAYNNYNVHDTCGPPTLTLADALCDAHGWGWACSHVGRDPPAGRSLGSIRRGYREHDISRRGPSRQRPAVQPAGQPTGTKPPRQPENYHCGGEDAMAAYLSRADVQAAAHVRPQPSWPGSDIEYSRSWPNLLVSPGYPDLIANPRLRVLIYSGDFDGQIPHCGTEEWTRGLGVPLASNTSYYRPWKLANGQVAGRVVYYSNDFAYATVAGAGHMVPTFKPTEGFELFRRFLAGGQY